MSISPKVDSDKSKTLSRTHVPDKVYAYSLQTKHALYELLHCSRNEVVSIEVFEDIAVEKQDGTLEVTQIKSSLSDNNPISDHAVDLWKTFYNWLLAVQYNELDIDTTKFKIFVAAEKKKGIIEEFSNADTNDKADMAWMNGRKIFYNKDGTEKEFSDTYKEYITTFFSMDNKSTACGIINEFTCETITDNYSDYLRNTFMDKVIIPSEILETAFTYMLGWIDETTSMQIENEKPMAIPYMDFKNELIAITRELNQNRSLEEVAPKPTEKQVQSEFSSVRRYIEQLNLVDCDYTEKIEAINDYLRAASNRTAWGNNGWISRKSIENYEESLIRAWKNEKSIITLTSPALSQENKGKLLYIKCKDKRLDIANMSAPDFFTPGCYHALSDEMTIGWHSEYKTILEGDKDE